MRFSLALVLVVIGMAWRPPIVVSPGSPETLSQDVEIRLPCVADANLSSYEAETKLNYGAATRIRLKGIQMLGVFRFDTAPLVGKIVEEARLYLRYAGNDRKLRTLGFSTIAVPWKEGSGSGDERPGELCFLEPELGRTHWTAPDSDFTDAAFLPQASMVSYADVRQEPNDWISARLDPRIVQAMAAGLSYGMAVTDEKGQTMANNDVFSREQSGSAPYLTVRCRSASSSDSAPPPSPNLKLTVIPDEADLRGSAARVDLTVSSGCLGVQAVLRIAGEVRERPVSPALVGLMPEGRMQTVLDGLPGDRRVALVVRAVGQTGAIGPPTRAEIVPPPAPRRPALLSPPSDWQRLTSAPARRSGPATVSLHPGLIRLERQPDEILPATLDHLWDGRIARIFACRGERIALTVGVRAPATAAGAVTLRMAMDRDAVRTRTYRVRYTNDQRPVPDLCLPHRPDRDTGSLDLASPSTDGIRQYLLEMDVPRSAPRGLHRGSLTVTVGDSPPASWPISLEVIGYALPQRPDFEVSLNTYGSPARASGLDPATPTGIAAERAYHRLAHEHRCTLAPLGYSHSGTIEPGYAPELSGTGASRHVSDWTSWDRRFCAYLTGEAFEDLPRTGQPVTHLYLPFHEAWPEDIRQHYTYRPSTTAYPGIISEHALLAGPIETLLSADYRAGIVSVIKDFAEHIRLRRWNASRFHFYLNNKYYYRDPAQGGRGTSWWLLDEPMHRDDWLALAYYAHLLKEATRGDTDRRIVFRADISRPQWQRDYLDGLVDLMVVNDELMRRPTLMRTMRRRLGIAIWHYGEAPAATQPLARFAAWPIRAYLAGADGIVPWQTIGSPEEIDRPSPTGLIVPGNRIGWPEPLATIRLKALARGAQDAELIRAVAARRGWKRDQSAAALAPYVKSEDWPSMRAALRHALGQSSRASQSAHSRGHAATAPAPRARPKP